MLLVILPFLGHIRLRSPCLARRMISRPIPHVERRDDAHRGFVELGCKSQNCMILRVIVDLGSKQVGLQNCVGILFYSAMISSGSRSPLLAIISPTFAPVSNGRFTMFFNSLFRSTTSFATAVWTVQPLQRDFLAHGKHAVCAPTLRGCLRTACTPGSTHSSPM